jgi:CO/xanthine dehydrogenase FAD-binding subunit
VEEVLALLAEHGDEAKVLAGGQSLVPMLAMRLARPTHLVDLNEVGGLAGISERDGIVAFGATTRERQAETSSLVAEGIPVLAEALPLIGHVSIRNRGTIGGSMAHADASAELPAVALITGAEMVVRSTRGQRTVPAGQFFRGHFTTAMDDDELLVEVQVPRGPAGAGWAFREVARRPGDFALVGVGAMVSLDARCRVSEGRVCLMGVGDQPVRAGEAETSLVGADPSTETFAAAAAEATRDLRPASDVHGSSHYRRHLARVTVRRALEAAAAKAGGS